MLAVIFFISVFDIGASNGSLVDEITVHDELNFGVLMHGEEVELESDSSHRTVEI